MNNNDEAPPSWEMIQTVDIPKDQSYENVQSIITNLLELEHNRSSDDMISDMHITYRDIEIRIRRKPKPYSYYFHWFKTML